MIKEKITKSDLEDFVVGQQKVFTLPNYSKARSAQSYANQMKNFTGKRFKAIISDALDGVQARTVTITRLA